MKFKFGYKKLVQENLISKDLEIIFNDNNLDTGDCKT